MTRGWNTIRQKRERKDDKLKKERKKSEDERLIRLKKKWHKLGPVWFASHVLVCPLDVPPHPDFNSDKNPEVICEGAGLGCPFADDKGKHRKFRDNGIPYHIVLSGFQIDFLNDLWKGGVKQAIIAAARGAGKTFVLAVWNCWNLVSNDRYSVTYMGGSSKQSKICQGYIDDWRYDVPDIYKIIDRSLRGIERYATTIWRGRIDFSACSPESARGPHVNEIDQDEVCVAEDKSEEGAESVRAAQWQLTGKNINRWIMASTAHYVHGMFYEYMIHPDKYGFKVYQWAIARHSSGKKPIEIYTDKKPENWYPNVWWQTKEDVEKMRRTKSDEEWLCEALGGASLASGAVFKKKDLDIIICNLCEECVPYDWDKCKLCKLGKLGIPEDPTKYILERRAGFDYGVSEAPCALTVVGRKMDVVFVLFNEEKLGIREEEKIEWIHNTCQQYGTWTFIPDPAVAGKHLNEKLEDSGYAVYIIPEAEKAERVYNVINFVEKHKIIIPKKFWNLTQSMRKLAWDKKGKIRKMDDHSFDTLQYVLVDWRVEEMGNIMDEFLEMSKKNKPKSIDDIWGIGFKW